MTEKESSTQLPSVTLLPENPASYFCYFLNPHLDKIRIRFRLSFQGKQETAVLKLLYVPGVFPEVYFHPYSISHKISAFEKNKKQTKPANKHQHPHPLSTCISLEERKCDSYESLKSDGNQRPDFFSVFLRVFGQLHGFGELTHKGFAGLVLISEVRSSHAPFSF